MIEEANDFEELKRLTSEALKNGEYGSGIYIRQVHYFIAGSSDKDNNKVEFGKYPIALLDEYNKFIEDNLPKNMTEEKKDKPSINKTPPAPLDKCTDAIPGVAVNPLNKEKK